MANKNVAQLKLGIPNVQPTVTSDKLFTPVIGIAGSIGSSRGSYSQYANRVRGTVDIAWNTITAVNSPYTLTLPDGLLYDPTWVPLSSEPMVGTWMIWDSSAGYLEYAGSVHVTSTSTLQFKAFNGTSYNSATAPITLAAGDVFKCYFDIPVSNSPYGATQAYGVGQVTGGRSGILPPTSTLSKVRVTSVNGYGSSAGATRRWSNLLETVGFDITYLDSATLGGLFTIVTAGMYAISYSDMFSAASNFGISRNVASGATGVTAITQVERIGFANTTAANVCQNISISIFLNAGDVIRAHTDTTASGANIGFTSFTIQRFS